MGDEIFLNEHFVKYYNSKAELFARSLESFFLNRSVFAQKAPFVNKTYENLINKNKIKSRKLVEQFRKKFPNATVNIVSGKRGYNGDEKGLHTWKHRKEMK